MTSLEKTKLPWIDYIEQLNSVWLNQHLIHLILQSEKQVYVVNK